ncbi:MAG TPA: DnaA regulatory inactivator Hda [Casimicrobiaceae bacterium]
MAQQLVFELARPEPPSLANFVTGANGEVVASIARLANGDLATPGLMLWGGAAAGKTHLLHAAIELARKRRPVFFCARPSDAPSDPDRLPPATLLAIDDLEHADVGAQARLFTLVNALPASGAQWIAAASVPPARLDLREDLRTRLALGLVLEVRALTDAEKPRALATYANERGFRLTDEVIAYLLAHARRDMPSLVAALAALDRLSLTRRRPVTVALVRDWLQRQQGPGA